MDSFFRIKILLLFLQHKRSPEIIIFYALLVQDMTSSKQYFIWIKNAKSGKAYRFIFLDWFTFSFFLQCNPAHHLEQNDSQIVMP